VAGGLVAATDVLGDRELFAFISGRILDADASPRFPARVGMDIVARNIEALGVDRDPNRARPRTTFHSAAPDLVILEAQASGRRRRLHRPLCRLSSVSARASDLHVLLHWRRDLHAARRVLPLIRLHRLFRIEFPLEATDACRHRRARRRESRALVDELLPSSRW